jgi:hypothetical protein
VLVGRWDEGIEQDQEAVAGFAREGYDDVQNRLNRWKDHPDAPFRQVGSQWRVNGKEDAWLLLSRFANKDLLERFEELAISVLSEEDPKRGLDDEERLMPRPSTPTRKYSDALRAGLADTIGMLGILDASNKKVELADGTNPSVYASRIVRDILSKSTENQDFWLDLAPHLQQLSEAAPEDFLRAIEQDLESDEPSVLTLFDPQPGFMSPNYEFPNLLWSLEQLAWSSTHFTRVVSILAKLASEAPETEIVNGPDRSLLSFYRVWMPQCGAPLDQRLAALDRIRNSNPEEAWHLMSRLLPKDFDSATSQSGPGRRAVIWREWPHEAERPTLKERDEALREVSARIIEDASENHERLLSLISKLPSLHQESRDPFLDLVEEAIDEIENEEWRDGIRNGLRKVINRQMASDQRTITDTTLDRLESIAASVEESDPIKSNQWLFSQRPDLPVDVEDYIEELGRCRHEALEEIYDASGVQGIAEFAAVVDLPHRVGIRSAELDFSDEETNDILDLLGSSGAKTTFAEGFVAVCSHNNEGWIGKYLDRETLEKWDAEHRVAALLQLPPSADLLDLVESLGPDTAQRYWQQKNSFWTDDQALFERALRSWIAHQRPRRAVDELAMRTYDDGFTIGPELVIEALTSSLGVDPEEDPTPIESHDIAHLLSYLRRSEEIDDTTIEHLEWSYFPLLKDEIRMRRVSNHSSEQSGDRLLLHRRLGRDPAFFVEVVSYAFKQDNQKEVTTEEENLAKRAYDLLDSWHEVPGYDAATDSIDEDFLFEWLDKAIDLLEEKELVHGGHIAIGKMLRWGPDEEDGIWPHPAICEAIEKLASDIVDDEFRTEVFNSRGTTSRGVFSGGQQERSLAERYESYAQKLDAKWPRVASILRQLADTYRSYARHIDERAERDEDDMG